MTTVQKFVVGIVAIGMVTTLVLPQRQSSQVITAGFSGTSRLLGTAMGTAKAS